MGLDSGWFEILMIVAAVASVAGVVAAWPRITGRRATHLAARLGLIAGSQLLVIAAFLVCLNGYFGFYGSWTQLLGGASPPTVAGLRARQQQAQAEAEQAWRRRHDMLSLLALGYEFQVRLAGQVAAAHAEEPGATARPALVAAITGRLALVAEQWLGIDPDQVTVSLHSGPGWGQAELTGPGEQRRLRVALPASWLARVWACGLALTGGQLVVAVERAGWPQARVLALRAPGADPVPLDVHARGAGQDPPGRRDVPAGAADAPHWEV